MSRTRGAVFQLRLSTPEAQKLEDQAKEAGLSKADLIRRALGWDITKRPTRTAPVRDVVAQAPTGAVDPDREPGKAALQSLAQRLGRSPR
jgi:hypothetical protein